MRRRAILIGNNTGHEAPTFLKGVTHDLINYKNYLKSGFGGLWQEETEISILHNRGRQAILSAIRGCYVDYSFVVFSGHGFINSRNGLTYICVNDGFISEDELNTHLHRQTLILDCCREVSVTESYHGDIGYFEKSERTAAISGTRRIIANSRQKFDNALNASNIGRFTGYACLTDQLSGDNPTAGGVFSSSLLRSGREFGRDDSYVYSWMPIKVAVQQAALYINDDPFSTQQPDFVMSPPNMALTFPFALTNKIQRPW